MRLVPVTKDFEKPNRGWRYSGPQWKHSKNPTATKRYPKGEEAVKCPPRELPGGKLPRLHVPDGSDEAYVGEDSDKSEDTQGFSPKRKEGGLPNDKFGADIKAALRLRVGDAMRSRGVRGALGDSAGSKARWGWGKKAAERAGKAASRAANAARERAGKIASRAKEKANKAAAAVKEKTGKAKQHAKNVAERAKKHAQKVAAKAREITILTLTP